MEEPKRTGVDAGEDVDARGDVDADVECSLEACPSAAARVIEREARQGAAFAGLGQDMH